MNRRRASGGLMELEKKEPAAAIRKVGSFTKVTEKGSVRGRGGKSRCGRQEVDMRAGKTRTKDGRDTVSDGDPSPLLSPTIPSPISATSISPLPARASPPSTAFSLRLGESPMRRVETRSPAGWATVSPRTQNNMVVLLRHGQTTSQATRVPTQDDSLNEVGISQV